MRTKSCKQKGRVLQNWTRDKLLSILPDVAPEDIQSRIMGCSGDDIILSPKARQQFPFSIECANQEKLNLWKKWNQCVGNANGYLPLAVIKRNNIKPLVVIDAEYFFELYEKNKCKQD